MNWTWCHAGLFQNELDVKSWYSYPEWSGGYWTWACSTDRIGRGNTVASMYCNSKTKYQASDSAGAGLLGSWYYWKTSSQHSPTSQTCIMLHGNSVRLRCRFSHLNGHLSLHGKPVDSLNVNVVKQKAHITTCWTVNYTYWGEKKMIDKTNCSYMKNDTSIDERAINVQSLHCGNKDHLMYLIYEMLYAVGEGIITTPWG